MGRWFAGACAAALLSGCGGNVLVESEAAGGGGEGGGGTGGGTSTSTSTSTSTGTGPGEVTPACLEYCKSIVQEQGCFTTEDCHGRCMSFHVPGCTKEVEAVLACTPDWMTVGCQITYPDEWSDGCYIVMDELKECGQSTLGSCSSYGMELIGATACEGYAKCTAAKIEIACDDGGKCSCVKDDVPVGSCAMPFTGVEACSPSSNCCRAFLDL